MTSRPAAVLAHELRSPVAALTAIADGATRSAAAERLHRLLELASPRPRASSGSSPTRSSLVAPSASTGRIADDAVDRALSAGVDVDAETNCVDGDPTRLRQALDNLVDNAARPRAASDDRRVTGARRGEVVVDVVGRRAERRPADLDRCAGGSVAGGRPVGPLPRGRRDRRGARRRDSTRVEPRARARRSALLRALPARADAELALQRLAREATSPAQVGRLEDDRLAAVREHLAEQPLVRLDRRSSSAAPSVSGRAPCSICQRATPASTRAARCAARAGRSGRSPARGSNASS